MSPGPLVVVGDTLLDVDLEGRSERFCPDAPVPVVDLDRLRIRPGGAGLAALVAARTGAPVVLITALGRDEAGDALAELLGGELTVVPQSLNGDTVIKARIRTDATPLARLDAGDGVGGGGPLSPAAGRALAGAGAVLVADYGRGMAGQHEIRELLLGRAPQVPLVWDPHPRGARPVAGATLLTPNASEADRVAAGAPDSHARGCDLRERWEAVAVAVTMGAEGALLTSGDPAHTARHPVPDALRAEEETLLDACGAGDRFASAAAEALRNGATLADAVANAVQEASRYVLAGGAAACSTAAESARFVQRLVLARPRTIQPRTIQPRTIQPRAIQPRAIQPRADVLSLVERTRRGGGTVVATGGCFDLLHRGHIDLLHRARALGDLLVVCLNSDVSVRRAKGPQRPVVGEEDRARVLGALADVDGVVVFAEDTPAALLDQLRPDIWVKGSDYAGQPLPEEAVVARHGGRVVLLPLLSGYSTTQLVDAVHLAAT